MVSVGCYGLDLLAVQRSLAGLQERLNDLHENAESRFAALVAERDVQAKEKEEAEHALEECRQQLEQVSLCLAQQEAEAKACSEQAELALLQLHQVQDELEYYFSLSRLQAKALNSSEDVFKRAVLLSLELSQ